MRLSRTVFPLIISIFVITIGFVIFIFNLSTISVPEKKLKYDIEGIKHNINIYKNQYGISHIETTTDDDLYFAMGYTHAFDRMWQMDFNRRAATGTLSEVIGKQTIEFDKFMRSLELENIAKKIWVSLDPESKNILINYSDGVNAFIETRKNKLPLEFGALDYIPEKWKPIDCLILGRAMAFELSLSFWVDVSMGEIAEKLGINKALELIPNYPKDAPFVCDENKHNPSERVIPEINIDMFYPGSQSPPSIPEEEKKDSALIGLYQKYMDNYENVRNILGLEGSSVGSNSWAINITKDSVSKAIFANDPHLRLSIPARWMQLHISSPSYNAVGLSVPGIPFLISGRNDQIAWGITNIMADGCDFFIEKIDSSGSKYFDGKEYVDFEINIDTIKISGQEKQFYYTRRANNSAVISDFHLLKSPELLLDKKPANTGKFFDKYVLTFKWTGSIISNEIQALAHLNKARNWHEFLNATNKWYQPAINFNYADINGNIGVASSGVLPIREKNCRANLPNPSWMDDYEWSGYVYPQELPKLYNPPKNYILSANNSIKSVFPHFITDYWEPPSRAERIEEMLKESDVYYSYRDAQNMQLDVLSPYARKLLEQVIPVLIKFESILYGEERNAYEKLKKWDYIISANSEVSSIYNEFFTQLIYNTFADELGQRLYMQYTFVSSLPTRKIMELMSEPSSAWFDNITTEEVERRDYIIIRSFKNAIENLSEKFMDKPMQDWKYSHLHTLTLEHTFSKANFLEPTVTVGPLQIGGNNTTINNTEYKIYDPYSVRIGASMRFIADMSDSLVYTSLPGGASGDPLSPNYSDQVRLWLNGGYLKMSIDRKPSSDFKLAIQLIPD